MGPALEAASEDTRPMILRAVAVLALVIAMLAHPAPVVADPGCVHGSGPFCANALLDPSAVTDAR